MKIPEALVPNITAEKWERLQALHSLYSDWNQKINVISRKDMDNFFIHHVLHSLSLCAFANFLPGQKVLDIGTGGGFPGVPLAIVFDECEFLLCDSIGKKLIVANQVCQDLQIKNVETRHCRAEELKGRFDYIVSRAVAPAAELIRWSDKLLISNKKLNPPSGWFFYKGGNLDEELSQIKYNYRLFKIYDKLNFDFFETKKIVYIEK